MTNSLSLSKKYSRLLNEAFEARRFNKGEVKFSEAKLHDPHIQRIIQEAAKAAKVSPKEIEDDLQQKIDKFSSIAQKAPLLYETIQKNIIESESFNYLEEHNINIPTCPEFDRSTFFRLVKIIKAENEQFYPLRSFLKSKRLYDAATIFSDNQHYPQYSGVNTAAATPQGVFIFNIPFMQRLMQMAHIKQIKPKGKKYECNGGDIPDEYCYIEFVIIHEFMHYTYDDFYFDKLIKRAPGISKKTHGDIINWVGDFRTNYLLVKSGFEQLPMGLFNDNINYDRQTSYHDMYNLVLEEMKKLNDEEREKIEDYMDDQTDDHEPGGEGGGEDDGDEEGEDGEGDGENDGDEDEDEDKETGKKGKGGKEDKEKTTDETGRDWTDKTMEDIDAHARKVEEQMSNSKDKNSEEATKEIAQRDEERKQEESKFGGRGQVKDNTDPRKIDYSKIKPQYDWASLMKKFIMSANDEVEETYQKPSRRGISGLHTAMQTGAGAMKPGDIPLDMKQANLCFCIDSSGSMFGSIRTIYANLNNLLKRNQGLQSCMFSIIKFSSGVSRYQAIFKGDKAASVTDVLQKPTHWDNKLSTIFTEHFGDATNFTGALVKDLKTLLDKSYNVLIISDTDVATDPKNYEQLMKLLKQSHKGKIFVIFDTRASYTYFIEKSKITSANITYLSETDKIE